MGLTPNNPKYAPFQPGFGALGSTPAYFSQHPNPYNMGDLQFDEYGMNRRDHEGSEGHHIEVIDELNHLEPESPRNHLQ